MAEEPNNIILAQLREMRGEFREMNAQVGVVGGRLQRMELSIDKFEHRAGHAMHLAGVANAQAQLAEKKADLALERQRQFAEDLNKLKARLDKG